MLASTVQFSTYDQPPVTRPHRPRPTSGGGDGGMRCRPALEQKATPRPDGDRRPGPAPSGPNSVPTTTHPRGSDPRTPRPKTRGAVLGAGDSRRPNWSAF